MAGQPSAASPPAESTSHGLRVVLAWLILSAVATPLVAIYVGHLIPPGNASTQATQQVFDNTWMLAVITPVICFLVVFFAYALKAWTNFLFCGVSTDW